MKILKKIISIENTSDKHKTLSIFSLIKLKFVRKSYISKLENKLAYYEKFVPLGHYYSVVPNEEDIEKHLSQDFLDLSNIDLNEKNQMCLFNQMIELSKNIDFEQTKDEIKDNKHYYFLNNTFEEGDGMFLNMFLRTFSPKKIIEIGSGFSTAMMLDTYKYYLKKKIDLTCIEPYPQDRLEGLLQKEDNINLIKTQLQEIPYQKITDELQSGDLLFIDSTHCVKYGSDVLYEFNKILPNLRSGVYVHFHDIHYPFENPKKWIQSGMNWNEVYFLKQFLANNDSWEIVLWPRMEYDTNREYMTKNFAKMQRVPGASIYLRKK